jgi:D-cysteine desulfhydrase
MPAREPLRIELARTPTPLLRLERLSQELDAALWIKRDDLTGLELSGNKVRKLEYVLAEAIRDGADTIVTEGTCQSNHCRATAAVCARMGLRCVLLFRPTAKATPQGNHLLDRLYGAETRFFERPEFDQRRAQIVGDVLEELKAAGRRPRWVPMGASEPLGCWGYMRAVGELAVQLHQVGIDQCDVIVAVSSGGTYAGMLLGQMLYKLRGVTIRAVPVSDGVAYHTRFVGDLCRAVIERYSLPIEFDDAAMRYIDGYVGEGYAVPYEADVEAIRLLARLHAIMLDPVYTGKAFCALLDGVRSGKLGRQRPVVFMHTGGIFSDFAWPDVLLGER